jgi:hypothetical protein
MEEWIGGGEGSSRMNSQDYENTYAMDEAE